MGRIKTWLTHNRMLKLISLLLAFFVWLIVVNLSNPRVIATVSVPFDVLNELSETSSRELYTMNCSSVAVSYEVRNKYRSLVTPGSFTAYVNMEDYSETNTSIPVYLEVDSSISDLIAEISVEPESVTVFKEKIQQKKFAVQYELNGEVASGYALGDVQITPEYTYIKGPVSVMGQVSSVGISIDVTGLSETLEGTSTISFYDANGNKLIGIEENLSFAGDITYTVPVYRIKSLTVNAFTGGAPASGYAVESVETNPTFISVYGPEEILNENSYILIPSTELNISGIRKNQTFNINAIDYVPEGLTLVEPKTEITILVKVKSILKESAAESQSVAPETSASPDLPGGTAAGEETAGTALSGQEGAEQAGPGRGEAEQEAPGQGEAEQEASDQGETEQEVPGQGEAGQETAGGGESDSMGESEQTEMSEAAPEPASANQE